MEKPLIEQNNVLTFVTGNTMKLAEVQALLPQVVGKKIDLPELQELDQQKIVEAKLRQAIAVCTGPVMVGDTGLYCECFASEDGKEGLPGPFIKWFLCTMSNKGIAQIAHKLGKTRARAYTIIAYARSADDDIHFFEGSVSGSIVSPQGTSGFGWDHIFIPDGYSETFARMGTLKKNTISPRAIAVQKLKKFLQR